MKKINWKKELRFTPAYLISAIWTVFTVVLLGWIVLASLSTTKEIFSGKLLQSGFQWKNYYKALIRNKAIINLMNSVIYTVPSCILSIVIAAPAAYCLGHFSFKGSKAITRIFIILISIPNIMLIMPLFSLANTLKMTGTHLTLIIIYTVTAVPYTTFFLITFFKTISSSFEEAATIDGCTPVKCFWQIMFPLAQPSLVTITIFNFIRFWNDYFTALIFANKPTLRPLGVGLYQMVQSMMTSGDWAGLFASVVIVFVPTVLMYSFLSTKIIAGVTAGGVKG